MDECLSKYKFVEEPCRNFCIIATTTLIDPLDGREKLILSNLVYKGTGNIILVDVLTGEGESIPLPDDNGAWAVYNLDNEKLLVGTCAKYGYVLSLDLRSRKWSEPLRIGDERYIWNFAKGSDGKIYAGTWPGAVLLRYDPKRHALENLGRASEHEGNMYTRLVFGDATGYIIISCCFKVQHVVAYDIGNGSFINIGKPGDKVRKVCSDFICLENGEELAFYDPATLEPMAPGPFMARAEGRDVRLKESMVHELLLGDGRLAGIRGQEYFIFEKDCTEPVLYKIPTEAPATGIITIVEGPAGNIWGATSLGQTIFRYNPETGEYWNSQVVCNNGGEVYGMRFVGDRLFLSAYAGGDHIVYDTSKQWDQINNINPMTLKSVHPKLTRPSGRSIIGPDGGFWTGWCAAYGIYGGGLSRIDTDTFEMTYWYDPVPEQGIVSIDCDDRYIYFTTNGISSGREIKVEPFHLGVWDPKGRLVQKIQFENGLNVRCVLVIGEFVLVSVGNEIRCFRRDGMEYAGAIAAGFACTCMVKLDEHRAAAFCEDKLFIVNPGKLSADMVLSLPGWIEAAALTSEGRLFFAYGTKLYEAEDVGI